ncbi:phosphoglycerate kinase [Caldiplasma sukawensis]
MENREGDFFSIDDFDLDKRTVLLRLDLNSPIQPLTGEIMSEERFRSHVDTIRRLRNSKVVILAHQSRPGKKDFTSLELHARKLSHIIGRKVEFTDSLFDSSALKKIESMNSGEILMLENTRFYSEEVSLDSFDYETMESTNIVKKLSKHAEYFVNDAFPAIHRNQTTLTGFTRVMPNIMGELVRTEKSNLDRFMNEIDGMKIAILAGAKIEDSIKVAESFLSKNIVEKILTGGVVSNLFYWAKGKNIGERNKDFIIKNNKNYEKLIEKARSILKNFSERIILPEDFILNPSEKKISASEDIPEDQIVADIGVETLATYSSYIEKAEGIFMNGPMGMYEIKEYSYGTYELLKEVARSRAMKIAGGGHTISALEKTNLMSSIDHVSTGGGALISYLTGEPMPVIESLKLSRSIFGGNEDGK